MTEHKPAAIGYVSEYGFGKLKTHNNYCLVVSGQEEKDYSIPLYDASLLSEYESLKRERDEQAAALAKIDGIRNSIIGFQNVNWSEHIYPLVAALEEAGIAGAGYPASRANVGTMLDRTLAAEARAEAAEAEAKRLREALENVFSFAKGCVHDGGFDREIGPIGCMLGDKCVCVGYATAARAALELK